MPLKYNLLEQKLKMMIKILKAEVNNETKNGSILTIKISSNQLNQVTLSPRKIRNKVANFFGENVQIPISHKKNYKNIKFIIEMTQHKGQTVISTELNLKLQIPNKNINNQTSMHLDNTEIKLFWVWNIQNPESIIETSFSHDLANIQTPKNKTMLISGLWSNQLRQFLSEHNNSKNHIFFQNSEYFLSEKEQKHTHYKKKIQLIKTFKIPKRKCEKQQGIKILKSLSFTTRSKTPSKKLKNQQKINTNIEIEAKQKNNSRTSKIGRQTGRRYSVNINKVGTIIAGAMGIFFGLASGIATHM